jgi:hypothetical protein
MGRPFAAAVGADDGSWLEIGPARGGHGRVDRSRMASGGC